MSETDEVSKLPVKTFVSSYLLYSFTTYGGFCWSMLGQSVVALQRL